MPKPLHSEKSLPVEPSEPVKSLSESPQAASPKAASQLDDLEETLRNAMALHPGAAGVLRDAAGRCQVLRKTLGL